VGPKAPIDLSAFSDSRYAQQLSAGFPWLAFPKDLEYQYNEAHVLRIRGRARVFLTIMPAILIADWLINGVMSLGAWQMVLEMAPDVLFFGVCSILVWRSKYNRLYLPGVTLVGAAYFALSAYILARGNVTDGNLGVAEFTINVPIMTYLLLGLTFYRALAINVLCTIVFFASALEAHTATSAIATYLALIPLVAVTAASIAYTMEHDSRRYFLQDRLLGELASRDSLTGLQNRGCLDSHLGMLWKQAQRSGDTLGLLLLDIDHFKGCNDTLGHQQGDDCLKRVAQILKAHVRRPLDLAARYGGEEFAIVLFKTTHEQLVAAGEEIRAEIQALALPNPAAPRAVITVSGGAAIVIPIAGRSMHGLIQMADESLYLAKNEGRNCIRLNNQDYGTFATGSFKTRNFLRKVS
jgi:diguanylate cyclase (GGDEF)-like protein